MAKQPNELMSSRDRSLDSAPRTAPLPAAAIAKWVAYSGIAAALVVSVVLLLRAVATLLPPLS